MVEKVKLEFTAELSRDEDTMCVLCLGSGVWGLSGVQGLGFRVCDFVAGGGHMWVCAWGMGPSCNHITS